MKVVAISSEKETESLAQRLAPALCGGMTVGLEGDLGAGKTTFVRYLVAALGGAAQDVASPTFTLQYDYAVAAGLMVEHWDLYRLRSAPQELCEPPGAKVLRIIEWPDKCPELLPDIDLGIRIGLLEGDARRVELKGKLSASLVL